MQAPSEARMQTDDRDVITRCQQGDLSAFEVVYAQYERQVYRYAYHLLGHREDADDVKQETFLRAYQAIGGFRRDSTLQTWLLRICGNLCRDRLRSWERRKTSPADLESEAGRYAAPAESDPAYIVEKSHTREMLLSVLNGLPASLKEAFVLHELEGCDYATMASVLGCSAASAKLRVFRARRMLRERVQSLLKAR